jgi:serine/threonine protein phosphatase PrpC
MCSGPEKVENDSAERLTAKILCIGEPGRAATSLTAGVPVDAGICDIALTPASVGRVEVRAASVRGLQHRHAAEPRQDAFALRIPCDGDSREELIAVVCDGTGSLPRSHEAADLVARRLSALAAEGSAWANAYAVVNDELREESWDDCAIEGGQLTMATTALAVRLSSEGDGWHAEVAWVGDSPLWHLNAAGEWNRCTEPGMGSDDGVHETASAALPSPHLEVAEAEFELDGGALFLMSDGVGNPLAWVDDVASTLAQWWATPPDIFDFGRQVGFARRTHMDDRTVVGLWLVQ